MANVYDNRQLPNSPDIEKSVLSSILISPDPKDAFEIIEGLISERDFFNEDNRLIFSTMSSLIEEGNPIDIQFLSDRLESDNNLMRIGGIDYLASLFALEPTPSNLEAYAKIVRSRSLQRSLINVLQDKTNETYTTNNDIDQHIDETAELINNLHTNIDIQGFKSIKEASEDNLKNIKLLSERSNPVTGLSTGFGKLDRITTGLHPNQLIIIAARPAVGKTAFVLNLAVNAAKSIERDKKDKPVVIFNMEMNSNQLTSRIISFNSLVELKKIETGSNLGEKDWAGINNAVSSLSDLELYIDDTPGININSLRAKLRKLHKDHEGLGLVVIDYLQLIETSGFEGRQLAVSEISRSLKKLSMELEVPIIALSQLSRGVESRSDRRPMLSDLRESGAIEQDADIVAFLYREDYYKDLEQNNDDDYIDSSPKEEEENPTSHVQLLIEKNRQGERGKVDLIFQKDLQSFHSVAFMDEKNK